MEILPGKFLYSYLKQIKLSFFSVTKLENRKILSGDLVTMGQGRRWGKGVGG
jgi:hypothetical protein